MDGLLQQYIDVILESHRKWRDEWRSYTSDDSLDIEPEVLESHLGALLERLRGNYPFFHPDYAGQMLKPPHPVAMLGYISAMLINPNNHALDGGPPTGEMEKEVVAQLAEFFGYTQHLGHLTSGGTVANMEALWAASREHPGKAIAFSSQSHYTHRRMCEVLGIPHIEVPTDTRGKMDMRALERLLLSEDIGTVVATIGTTGVGALDPLPEIIRLKDRHSFRVHADAAYGGFYHVFSSEEQSPVASDIYRAMQHCDSIVIDPHKHGLQPYGCGCILFADPAVGKHYKHDSPYTYFTSEELHLGEISLECSRAGAAAAALWLTLRCFPLEATNGIGSILWKCRAAALEWADLLRTSERWYLVLDPELDIVVFFPRTKEFTSQAVSERSDSLFRMAMDDKERPVYLSKLRLPSAMIAARYPEFSTRSEWTTVFRSTLMKPEHLGAVPGIHGRMDELLSELETQDETRRMA
ncbi:MAG: aspartate aminotransferase family protein [Ectothiorhodospiraceae bacterium]|nr:aspartate aminotransferase family protein [Ectothiorhodospiraceae bacterium]